MADHPCNTCGRWWECNGVAWDTSCPWNPANWPKEAPANWPKEAPANWPKVNPYISEKTKPEETEENGTLQSGAPTA